MAYAIDSDLNCGAFSTNASFPHSFFSSLTGRWIVPNVNPIAKQGKVHNLMTFIVLAQGQQLPPAGIGAEVDTGFGIGTIYSDEKNLLGFTGYRAFFWAGQAPDYTIIQNFPILAGDTISAVICSSGGSTLVGLTNESNNTAFTMTFSSAGFQSNFAGWIVGTPNLIVGPAIIMPKFGAVVFDDVAAGLDNGHRIDPSILFPYLEIAGPNPIAAASLENTPGNVVCEYMLTYP